MDYFHVAPIKLSKGSVIEPGNYGRIINQYVLNSGVPANGYTLARETLLESVRATKYVDKPSRLTSAFVFDDPHVAVQQVQNGVLQNTSIVYRVKILNERGGMHRAGFNLINFPPEGTTFRPYYLSVAEKYWQGEAIEIAEMLVDSPLEIIEVVYMPT
ncbi:MAG TPA: hypothetical protein VFF75_03660 [Methylophilaceae bacterium]|nr:hypothetical protein [Methylophilaceae bacterium]